MKFNQVTDIPYALGGTLSMTIDSRDIILHADQYPGSPGNPNFVAAAEMKYDKAVKALKIEPLGRLLKDQISVVGTISDVEELRKSITEASETTISNQFKAS